MALLGLSFVVEDDKDIILVVGLMGLVVSDMADETNMSMESSLTSGTDQY